MALEIADDANANCKCTFYPAQSQARLGLKNSLQTRRESVKFKAQITIGNINICLKVQPKSLKDKGRGAAAILQVTWGQLSKLFFNNFSHF